MSDAESNARAWLAEIVELAARLQSSDYETADAARDEAMERPLSVEVRDAWRAPTMPGEPIDQDPVEFSILLTTGGPGLRVWGDFGPGMAVDCAELQYQDWGTPWTPLHVTDEEAEAIKAFASAQYLGNE
jgi:hypothetical protein